MLMHNIVGPSLFRPGAWWFVTQAKYAAANNSQKATKSLRARSAGFIMEFRIISLASAESRDGPVRKRGHLASTLESLCASFLCWCQNRGLLLIPSESCSCYHRIRLARRRGLDTRGLVFAEVRKSLPAVTFPRNCSETKSYILSIQALEKVRRCLTIADHEIFAQAWFRAGRFYSCSSYTRSRTKELAPPCDTPWLERRFSHLASHHLESEAVFP
jgi:hypothetical protein